MHFLDTRTLSLVALLTSVLFAAGLLLVYKTIPRDRSLYLWALGASAGVPGFVLYALRGAIPDLLSIVVANTLLIAGAIWLYLGHRRFFGWRTGLRWHWGVLGITAALLCYYTYAVPSLWARTYSISAATAAIFLASAWVLLHPGETRDRAVRWFMGAAYLANALFMGTRVLVMPFASLADQEIMTSGSLIYTLTLVFEIGLVMVLAVGLPLLMANRQQRQLAQSEERFRSIVHNSSDAIFVRDASGRMIYASPLCERVMGYPKEFFMDKARNDIVHPDDLGRLDAAREKLKRTGEGFRDVEFRVVLPDGRARWLSGAAAPLVLPDGTIGQQSSVHDIDQRKRAQMALEMENERNRTFLRNASDGVHILDAQGNVLEVSDSFCEMLGYTREELIGANVSLWDAQWDAEEIRSMLARQFGAKEHSTFETRHRRRDGTVIEVEITGKAVSWEGRPMLFNSARDITERKRAQSALDNFFEQAMSLHLIARRDGVIERANRGWETILGYAPRELVGNKFLELVHPDDRAGTMAEMSALAQGVNTYYFENRYRHRNGEFRRIAWSASISIADHLIYAVGNDITDRQQAEEMLRQQANELRASNEDLRRFNAIAIGRELRMVELKQEVNALCEQLAQAPRYGNSS